MSGLLQWMTAISLLMHIAFFGAFLFILKRSKPFVMPSPYIVNLVSPETGSGQASHKDAILDRIEGTATEAQVTTHEAPEKPKKAGNKEQRLSDRIAALKAKKRIEQLEQTRASASIKSGKNRAAAGQITTGSRKAGGQAVGSSATDRYKKLVEDEIRSNWLPTPETRDKNLMTIISIKVNSDGSIQKIELIKSSGNQLFDRSVQRAITKSSLPQDPPDTEVELRFHP